VKKVVVLTGAGISAESGLKTFRDAGGLWEGYHVEEVASPSGWRQNPELVLDFYNQRRRAVLNATPNAAHIALAELEKKYSVTVVTQNIDDLHERAGSTDVLHLHGEILKARSSCDERLVYEWEKDIVPGDKCEKGSQLRPHIVWFNEPVPMIEYAAKICSRADIFLVIGSSLVVYPAAGLVEFVGQDVPKYVVDPKVPEMQSRSMVTFIEKKASEGVPELVKQLLSS